MVGSKRCLDARTTLFLSVAAVTAGAGCGGKESTAPPPPTSTPTAIASISGDKQTDTVGKTLPQPLVVRVTDKSGMGVAGVTVTWAVTAGGGSLAVTSMTTDAQGQALVAWTLGTTAGTNTATATANSLVGSPVTFTATGSPGAARQLVFTVQPTTAVAGTSILPALQVSAQDAAGNLVSSFAGNVTIAIGTNSGGGTLSGTTTAAAISGVATFSTLSIDKAGTGYTLTAGAVGLVTAISTVFNIVVGPTSQLPFTTQPTNTTGGVAISPAVQVTAQDAYGNTATGFTGTLTVAIGTNPAGGTLSGTTSVVAANGAASFSTLRIDKAGTGYTLTAAASGLPRATSTAFNIAAGPASRLVFTTQPTSAVAGNTIVPAVQVSAEDTVGNVVSSFTGAVTIAIGTNPGGGAISGTTTAGAAAGAATFSDLSINNSATGYTLTATTGALTAATSSPFNVWRALNLASVSTGYFSTCGVTTGGVGYCWGLNANGQLGIGTTTGPQQCGSTPYPCSTTPVVVVGGLTFATMSGGGDHACGLTPTGAAYCWGWNYYGQLGDGSVTQRTSPTAVSGGLTFAALSGGGYMTCGLATGGTAYCWGDNSSGQLGIGTSYTANETAPTAVAGGLAFAMVAAGYIHSCGVTTSGAAYCWGWNSSGQLGMGTTNTTNSPQPSPVPVAGGLTFTIVSPGEYSHTCGVTTAGAADCWGDDQYGQLGIGTTTGPQQCRSTPSCSTTPLAVLGGLTLTTLSAGLYHTCGVTTSGAAYCWGSNNYGQLGDGTTTNRSIPVPVLGGLSFVTVSAGETHNCGRTTTGAVYCWGGNDYGQLGDGTTTPRTRPVAAAQP